MIYQFVDGVNSWMRDTNESHENEATTNSHDSTIVCDILALEYG